MDFKRESESETREKYLPILRRPVAAIKKRSGPLDNALLELCDNLPLSETPSSSTEQQPSADVSSTRKPHCGKKSIGGAPSGNKVRRCSTKDKEKKRERWLLTRKTWKYMTDAGRKLIPEGSSSDNIASIEEQFQRVCLSEPGFILWRRRTSYPWSSGSSRRSLKLLSRHASASRSVNRSESTTNSVDNLDRTIELLQTYLKLRDERKTTALLSAKTVRPDQTSSPSAQRPVLTNKSGNNIEAELISRLKFLTNCNILQEEGIQSNAFDFILNDKKLLRKIYSSLKKQQLHRSLHSKEPSKRNVDRSSSLTSLFKIANYESTKTSDTIKICPGAQTSIYSELNNSPKRREEQKQGLLTAEKIERSLKTCGTQTSFVQLNELRSLADKYQLGIKNLEINLKKEESEKQDASVASRLSCRKSSIDEDISPSVSDTIKRYLKMARKKSLSNSDSNRFKSINYDTNLRNIKGTGDIYPPGISEGLNKAVQTLDAWPLLALDFIRGNDCSTNLTNAHLEWTKSEDERTQRILEWRKSHPQCVNNEHSARISSNQNPSPYSTCISAPTSPTSHSKLEKALISSSGLLSSSSQFISNILHVHSHAGSTYTQQNQNKSQGNETSNMQKSKSLSNVGQFMTKKIWGSRSKSQNRRNPAKDCSHLPALKWYPSTNCLWVSESGENFQIAETSLVKLSKTESDLLKDFALEKIKEFNIANVEDLKKLSQKRQIVQKKKSMTTTFFDVGRKYERNGGSLRLFGASLESCLARDLKRSDDIDNRSKYSLMSVFRGGGSNPGSIMKLNDNVRSCESLPSKSLEYGYVESSESLSDSNTSVSKRSTSQSQFESENSELSLDKHYQDQKILMVPKFVNQCIDYLEENGLHKVGIFRVSTSKKRVMQLREEFDKSSNLMISADTCPHDVATLLKEFLRDLPEPLLCDKLYSTFLKTQRIRNRRLQLEAISHLIRLLPIPNRDTLYVLLVFLAKVAAHCDDTWSTDKNCLMVGNKMDSNNLATVFAPNILRSTFLVLPSNREEENISDAINVIRILIDHYKEIFKISPELLNCIYTQVLEICPEKLYELISTKINSHEWYENIDHSSDIDLMIEKCPGAESQIKTGHTNDVMGSREQNLQVLSASLKISLPEQAQTNVKANLKNQENKTSCQKLSKIPAIPSDPGSTTLSANTAQFEKNVVSNSSNNFGNIGNCQTGAPKKHTYKRQHLISSSRRISQGP